MRPLASILAAAAAVTLAVGTPTSRFAVGAAIRICQTGSVLASTSWFGGSVLNACTKGKNQKLEKWPGPKPLRDGHATQLRAPTCTALCLTAGSRVQQRLHCNQTGEWLQTFKWNKVRCRSHALLCVVSNVRLQLWVAQGVHCHTAQQCWCGTSRLETHNHHPRSRGSHRFHQHRRCCHSLHSCRGQCWLPASRMKKKQPQ